jgi:hypothetical protein
MRNGTSRGLFPFQDPANNEGFEVYVIPYSGTQITAQEFKLDEPSGVMQDPTNVVIDGAQATMFYGNNPIMGDTARGVVHQGWPALRSHHVQAARLVARPDHADLDLHIALATDTIAYIATRQPNTPPSTGSPVPTLRHAPFDQWQRYGSV